MSTGEDLLRAIAVGPDDHALRLVYADWLEETGDETLAAFIRVNVAIEGQGGDQLADPALRAQHSALYSASQEGITLPKWARRWGLLNPWNGIVTAVEMSASSFLRYGRRLDQYLPGVRLVHLSAAKKSWQKVAAHEGLRMVRELPLMETETWPALRESPLADHLERLSSWYVPALGAARTPWPRLREISLSKSEVDELFLHWLSDAVQTPALERVRLRDLSWSYEWTEFLGRLLPRKSLLELHLGDLWAGDTYLWLPEGGSSSVRVLSLNNVHMYENDYRRFLLDAEWPNLEQLLLWNSDIPGSVIHDILRSDAFPRLWRLGLKNNPIDMPTTAALCDLPGFARLRALSWWQLNLDDEAGLALARSPNAANLEVLDLAGNRFTDAVAHALIASPYLNNLRRLHIYESFSSEAEKLLRSRFPVL